MGIKRKQHSAEFKARVAMAALSGEKTLAELSAEFGVHPTMISDWKQELVGRARFSCRAARHLPIAARRAMFTKAPHVLRAMGFDLDENVSARRELAEKAGRVGGERCRDRRALTTRSDAAGSSSGILRRVAELHRGG